jgi:hypothetical protein
MKQTEQHQRSAEMAEVEAEPELKQWLMRWDAPAPSARLDEQVWSAYRQQFPRRPWWRHWLTASIRIPVPVAVAAGLLLCVMSWLAARQTASFVIQPPAAPAGGVAQTTFVEVPVVQEKLVTRLVYAKNSSNTSAKLRNQSKRGLQLLPVVQAGQAQADLAGFRPVSEIKIEVNP